MRVHHAAGDIVVRTGRRRLIGVDTDGLRELNAWGTTRALREPWIIAFGGDSDEEAALLLTFTRRVKEIGRHDAGWAFTTREPGASTLELRSFWQCTNFLFYNNKPLFDVYRRFGLVDRVRVIEYELMPSLHPRWLDGNASDACGENGQPLYGAAWTAAHLHARATLFREDDALALFRSYAATKGTEASRAWYTMQLPEIAGPLMLALLERMADAEGEAEPIAGAPPTLIA